MSSCVATDLPHQASAGKAATALERFLQETDDRVAFQLWLEHLSNSQPRPVGNGVKRWLNQQIAAIDERVCEQLNTLLHHPRFQRLESSWRGLWSLIECASGHDNIKIRMLDVSWKDVVRDMQRAPDFDQSGLFQLIYNAEFGTPGGEPFGVLLGDYYISHKRGEHHPGDDIFTLQGISRTAAAAFAPFVCSAAPALFGLDSYDTLGQPLDLESVFRQHEYLRWRSLREQEDSRFLALTLPQVLMREPYQDSFAAYGGLRFREDCGARHSRHYLWGNACFALGSVLIREFADVGWFAHVRGAPRDALGGGLVTQFPALKYRPDSSACTRQMVTPVLITDTRERELSELGFISLSHCYQTPFAAFNSCPSLQKPRDYDTKAANARIKNPNRCFIYIFL